ncbi:MAG: sugar kinase [Spirochaetales bacterium]|nr:MAG: sugar kinase [Spirochaetales bacterium]
MEKIILIHRPTRLDSLVARFNTRQQAKFYIEHLNADFSDYEREHDTYYKALERLAVAAGRMGKVQQVEWKFLPNFIFGKNDLVLTVGQDGLVANTLKYLDSQKVIGFNPDSERWDGVLSRFAVKDAQNIIEETFNNESSVKKITKAKVQLSDNQVLYAVNDFFIGIKNHSSARYTIRVGDKSENHSSSGVIVSTPLGQSGWMKSIMHGAAGIAEKLSENPVTLKEESRMDWGKDMLTFAVREPFPSVSTDAGLIFGNIDSGTKFEIESKMGENGFVFSDGIQDDFLDFNYSVIAEISIAGNKGNLVVN